MKEIEYAIKSSKFDAHLIINKSPYADYKVLKHLYYIFLFWELREIIKMIKLDYLLYIGCYM